MKPYDKIPKKVRHHMAVAILTKTFLDNIENKSKKSEFFSRKYGSGIKGFEIKVGAGSIKETSKLSIGAWQAATGGKMKIYDSVDELVWMLSSTIPKHDHFQLFHVKNYQLDEINEERCNRYATVALAISNYICNELGLQPPHSKIPLKKVKKKENRKPAKNPFRNRIKYAKQRLQSIRNDLVISMVDDTITIMDMKGTVDSIVLTHDYMVEYQNEKYNVVSEPWNDVIHGFFELVFDVTKKGRYEDGVFQRVFNEFLEKEKVDYNEVKTIKLVKGNL